MRVGVYTLTSLLGLGLYFLLIDFSQVERDKYVDKTLAAAGPGKTMFNKTKMCQCTNIVL